MKQSFALISVLFIALVLRLVHLDQSLWLDEAISALAARDYTFLGIVTDFLKADNHPPLFYQTLRAWGLLVGFSDVSLRLLSVLFGVMTVFMTYLISKKITASHKFAITSSILLATSPLHVYYSQELRMYPMIAFEASLLIFIFLKLFDESRKILPWILFSIMLAILVATDYITLFLLPVFPLFALVKRPAWNWWIKFVMSGIPLVMLALLWSPFFINQSLVGKNLLQILPNWALLAGGANLKELVLIWMKFVLGRISLEDKQVYYGLVGIFSLSFIFLLYRALWAYKKYLIIWIWLLVPLVLGFVASFIVPAFTYFRFIYVLPAFYTLLAVGFKTLHNTPLRRIFAVLILGTNLLGLTIYYVDPFQKRENWKQAVEFIEIKGEAEDLSMFEFNEPFAPYKWYSRGEVEGFGALNELNMDTRQTKDKITGKLSTHSGKIYHFSYLRDLTDNQRFVENVLNELDYLKLESRSFDGVGEVSIFVKRLKDETNDNENN
jgi:mannosyltransferase